MARPNLSRSLPGVGKASSSGSRTTVLPSSRVREEKGIVVAICFIFVLKMRCVGSESESVLQELQYSHAPGSLCNRNYIAAQIRLQLSMSEQSPQPAKCRRTPSFATYLRLADRLSF